VIGSYIHAKLLDYPPFAGRPLPTRQPRSYRRKVSGKELAGQGAQAATPSVQNAPPAQPAAPQGQTASVSTMPTETQG